MKKAKIVLASIGVLAMSFGVSAFAMSVSPNPVSASDSATVTCTNATDHIGVWNSGGFQGGYTCASSVATIPSGDLAAFYATANTISVLEFTPDYSGCTLTSTTTAELCSNYVAGTNTTVTILAAGLESSGFGLSVLGGTAPSVGTPLDGTAFIAGTASAVQSGMDTNGPIIAVVIAIILAFVLATKIVFMFREVDDKKKKTLT